MTKDRAEAGAERADSRHGPRPGGGADAPILGLSILFLVALVAAGVWSLAGARFDPVGVAFARGGDLAERYGAWVATDPLDGAPDWQAMRLQVLDGDPTRAPAIMRAHGCGSCHEIPGLARAHGSVGPDLTRFADRAYIAGILPNEPGQLVRWLIDPTIYAPDTAMPDLDLTEAEAEDIAAYLYGVPAGPRAAERRPPA
ncbi:MAG: c-type cytochrome [Shimia sp.]